MADTFPVTEAQIVALFAECIAYGIYLVSLAYCLRVLLCDGKRLALKPIREIKWPMVAVAMAMAVFGTLDVIFGLVNNVDAFVYYDGPGGAEGAFSRLTNWVSVMKSIDSIAQTTLGDGMLIYRLYVVYGRNVPIIVLPVIAWLGYIASSCVGIWIELSSTSNALLSEESLRPVLYTIFSLTLVVNVLVTSLIAVKLWWLRRDIVGTSIRPDRLSQVARIMTDSAMFYTLSMIILFGVNIAGNNALYPVSDVIVQIIGITFNLIIVRVATMRDGVSDIDGSTATDCNINVPLRIVSDETPTTTTFALSTNIGPETPSVRDSIIDGKGKEVWNMKPSLMAEV